MKADEAIQILKTWRNTGDKAHEALDMAISALQELKNSSQELKNSSDLISRSDAIDALIEEFKRAPTIAIRAKDMIEQLPSAQPEPSDVARDIATIIENEKDMRVVLQNSAQTVIIYCKNCEHYQSKFRWCKFYGTQMEQNDYCSYAERREE